jgi:hypothetical protein
MNHEPKIPLKSGSKQVNFGQFPFNLCKKMQKNANFCSFLPSFFAQKRTSPIKSRFLLPPTTLFFKKTVKNPIFVKNPDNFSSQFC